MCYLTHVLGRIWTWDQTVLCFVCSWPIILLRCWRKRTRNTFGGGGNTYIWYTECLWFWTLCLLKMWSLHDYWGGRNGSGELFLVFKVFKWFSLQHESNLLIFSMPEAKGKQLHSREYMSLLPVLFFSRYWNVFLLLNECQCWTQSVKTTSLHHIPWRMMVGRQLFLWDCNLFRFFSWSELFKGRNANRDVHVMMNERSCSTVKSQS